MLRRGLAAVAFCALMLAMGFAIEVRVLDVAPPPPAALPAAKQAYVGNTNTHKFHRLSCRYAGCPNCTAKFATREEAIKAGYRPCGVCEP